MFVKTKQRGGRTVFYLCIAEAGGGGWKTVEYSVCLGETLDLSSTQWLETLRASSVFRSVSLHAVLEVMEQYVAKHRLPGETLAGLREAMRGAKQKKSRRNTHTYSERRSQQDTRTKALRLLGLPPGSSENQIESAFRKAALRHHPDVGGDPTKFRAIVEARNMLLGRDIPRGEPA